MNKSDKEKINLFELINKIPLWQGLLVAITIGAGMGIAELIFSLFK